MRFLEIRPVHIVLVAGLILGASLSLNLYLYFEGFYIKADNPSTAKLKTVDLYYVNKSMFPMIVDTTIGETRIPVPGKINIFTPQYINCPDICHMESLILVYIMNKSVAEGFSSKLAFITVEVDPVGTNKTAIINYMKGIAGDLYDRIDWIWVTGDKEKLEKLWGQLGIKAQRDDDTGLVGHTAGFFIVDGDTGMIIYYVKPRTWDKPLDTANDLVGVIKDLLGR